MPTIKPGRNYRDRHLWVHEYLNVSMAQDWESQAMNINAEFVALSIYEQTAISGGSAGAGLTVEVNTTRTPEEAPTWLPILDHVSQNSAAAAVETMPIVTPSGDDLYHILFLKEVSVTASLCYYNQIRIVWKFGSRTAGAYDFHMIQRPFRR